MTVACGFLSIHAFMSTSVSESEGLGGDAFEHEFVYLNVACLFVSEKECGFVCECLRCCCGREDMCLSVCLQFSSGHGYIDVPLRLGSGWS